MKSTQFHCLVSTVPVFGHHVDDVAGYRLFVQLYSVQ